MATVVVLAVSAAMSARSPAPARRLAEQSYLDQVFPIIQDSTQQGRDIDAVRNQALQLSSTTITGRLDQVVGGAERSFAAIRRIQPPKSMQTAHDLLVATLAVRADGTRALRQAMNSALGAQPTAAAVTALGGVGVDLEASDKTYALFVKQVPAVGVQPPPSQWVPDPSVYDQASLTVFLTSLRSAASLAPVHDVAVVLVTTDPEPVSLNGTTQVLPVAKLLNLQIVVADTGNQAEKNLTVSATIAPSAIGPTQMLRDFVDLTAGQRRTVQLGGLRLQ
ncbi:MAG TPA: hypothetical protein VLL25_15670, partial [Acidimicrobiales bacterium]|nr:hypothetical protein [Acidimicrobiales bacterium]